MRNRILKGWGEIHIIFTPLQILFILSKHHDTLRCIFFFRDSRERGRKVRRKFKFSLEKKKEDIRIILKFIFKSEVIRIFDIIEKKIYSDTRVGSVSYSSFSSSSYKRCSTGCTLIWGKWKRNLYTDHPS